MCHTSKTCSQRKEFQQGHAVEETERIYPVKGIIEREMTYIKELFNSVDVDGSGSIDRDK